MNIPHFPGVDGHALTVGFWKFLQRRQCRCPLITTSRTCANFNRPPTASLSNDIQPLYQLYFDRSASDSLSIVSIKQAASVNVISGHSLPISPPFPNSRQITASCRSPEISDKLDSGDTMKVADGSM
jgi:hypothetical protein